MSYIEISKQAEKIKRVAQEEKVKSKLLQEFDELEGKYPHINANNLPDEVLKYWNEDESRTLLEAYEMVKVEKRLDAMLNDIYEGTGAESEDVVWLIGLMTRGEHK